MRTRSIRATAQKLPGCCPSPRSLSWLCSDLAAPRLGFTSAAATASGTAQGCSESVAGTAVGLISVTVGRRCRPARRNARRGRVRIDERTLLYDLLLCYLDELKLPVPSNYP